MDLFSKLKNIPKLDLHIDLTSSISPLLAYNLKFGDNIQELEYKMVEKNYKNYLNSLEIPIKILSDINNIEPVVKDIINSLRKNNIYYAQIYFDLTLYIKLDNIEDYIKKMLTIIKSSDIKIDLILVLSSNFDKETNLKLLSIAEKYYQNGIMGIYFNKNKMDNILYYSYIFDRIKNKIPYILEINTKISYVEQEIYYNANRLIYMLNDYDKILMNEIKKRNIMLEFSISNLIENKIINDIKDFYLYDLIKDNYNITIATKCLTVIKTDIINEYCLLFNNYDIKINEIIKIINNNLNYININQKDELINKIKEIEVKVLGE